MSQQNQKISGTNGTKIFCVIPTYNEAKTINQVIASVKPLVDQVIVVDDGSTDNSYNLAERNNVIVLRHLINRGQGAALKTGTKYAINAGAEIIIHFDADGQFLAQDIKAILQPIINNQAEIVFGSRFLDKTNRSTIPGIKKYLIIPLAKLVNKLFLGVDLTDPQSGFRAMTGVAAKQINWQQDRMAHCSEILQQAKLKKLKIKEVPINIIL